MAYPRNSLSGVRPILSGLGCAALAATLAVPPAMVMMIARPAEAQGHTTSEQDGHDHEGGQGGSHGDILIDGGEGGHDGGGHGGTDQGGAGAGGGAGDRGEGEGEGRRLGSEGGPGGERPPWAQDGLPVQELGRLNVARSPERVIDRAYAEALAQLPAVAAFYNLPLSRMADELATNWDRVALIDSPLQNLALLRDALDGQIDLRGYGISNDRDTLMAAFLGIASDKEIPVTAETAYAVSVILGMPLSEAAARDLAARAEAIRQAVVAGHG
ncbi:hypothetical protein HKCCE3408_04185 [Rhodobacterales bacterium HKCCE3408]|nr:hypothetical protein [Rhodobacterales bacterium HKCCE3408]